MRRSQSQRIGRSFEENACKILQHEGFSEIELVSKVNPSMPYDILAKREGKQYFVEVKFKTNGRFIVKDRKIRQLSKLEDERLGKVLFLFINGAGNYRICKLKDMKEKKIMYMCIAHGTHKRYGTHPLKWLQLLQTITRPLCITELAKALKISNDRASSLAQELQECRLAVVKTHRTGRRGRPFKMVFLTPTGHRVIGLLKGKVGNVVEIREENLIYLVKQALEKCKDCCSTKPLNKACVVVSSYAHLLGLDWERGVPICSCRRLPKLKKSWYMLVATKNSKDS